ncbi:predicted protein [Phaeodactylum tricornutum CCAP 1055/1]|uniref:Uncharacterized protein n=1 Tax=Phaeodactylum tricornutum (strain CCAP 1055/1) TaxID=556484 RepID=B7GAN9_PHATC|nr:predicted protein [Phaeodactylum tricornutum CCAP 1055/1]EEC44405.1 predicted protein [Phaeodactylum tricornutum CCAP 1055/1]|eukprot:XP_002184227.1 predicted protein [Phaeodactylum tricornutum CCAP 1055/1]
MQKGVPMHRVPQPQHQRCRVKLQCLVLGAAGAGKTSLLRRYFHNAFQAGTRVPTLGSDFYTGRVPNPLQEHNSSSTDSHVLINLQMWERSCFWLKTGVNSEFFFFQDTPGRERFYSKRQRRHTDAASLGASFFRQADAVMLVYDMTSSTSFTQLLKWYADLVDLCQSKPVPILIVANKLDLFIADQQRASTWVHPRRVSQRDVLGLAGSFRGNDFRYEYRVSTQLSPNPMKKKHQRKQSHRRMEISSFLANRENWTTDGSYLESLLNSEDASHPDREMVLLWCMRNGLKHVEVSAATGEHVDGAIDELIRLALLTKQSKNCDTKADLVGIESQPLYQRNDELNVQERYQSNEDRYLFQQRKNMI